MSPVLNDDGPCRGAAGAPHLPHHFRDVAQPGQRTCFGCRGPVVRIHPSRRSFLGEALCASYFGRDSSWDADLPRHLAVA
jgi:hypothetical protein